MSDDLNTEIKIGADASGVEAGVGRAKRSLATLGDAAKKAGSDGGKGMEMLGTGGDKAAAKVESATRSMQNSIQRLIAEQKAGEKGSRAYYEALADTKGISRSSLKPLLDQLDEVKRQTDAAKNAADDWRGSLGKIGGVAIGAAIGTAVVGIGAMVKQTIDAADSFSKLSAKSGVAVESLRELNYAASLSDVSTESLGTGLRKLSQNMAAAAGGSKQQAAAFDAIGVSVKNADGSLKGADTTLKELASKFSTFKDGPEKAALAIELFGKQGAELIPLLNGGAAGLADMADEANRLGIVFDGELAKNAEAFNDNLTRIKTSAEGAAVALTSELLPTFNSLAQSFVDADNGSQGLASTLGGAVRTVLEAITITAANVAFVLKGVGREIGAIAAQGAALARLDFDGFTAISDAVKDDGVRARKELDKFTFDLLNARILTSKAGAGRGTAPDPRALGVPDGISAPIVKQAGAAAKAAASEYDKLIQSIKSKTAATEAEFEGGKKLNDAEKLRVELLGKMDAGLLKLTATEKQNVLSAVQAYDVRLKDTEAAKEALALAIQRQQVRAKESEGIEAYMRAQTDAQVATVKAANDAVTAAQFEFDTYGKSKSQLAELTLARLQDKLAGVGAGTEIAKAIEAQIDAQKRLIGILSQGEARDAGEKAAKAAADEWQKTADSIESSLTDALLRGFESGKDFAKNLRDTLVNMFKTLILRPIISAVVNPVAGALTGALSLASPASAATGASGLGGLGNLLGSGISSAITGGLSAGFGGLTGTIGSLFGAAGTGATLGGSLSAGGIALGAGNIVGGLSTIVGALGPIALGIVAVASLLSGKADTRYGSQYAYTGGNSQIVGGPNRGVDYAGQSAAQDAVIKGINNLLKSVGSNQLLAAFDSGFESSEKGKGFSYAGGQLNTGAKFGQGNGSGYLNNRGSKTPEQAIAEYQDELLQATLQALQAAGDLPKTIAASLAGVNIDALTGDALKTFAASINKQISDVENFRAAVVGLPFKQLRDLSFDAAAGLIAAGGGLESLSSNLGAYYENFYSEEEKRAQTIASINAATAGSGLDAANATRESFRALVEAQDLTTEAGQKAYASLIGVSGAFAGLTPVVQSVATAVSDVMKSLQSESQKLEIDLLRAQGNTSGADTAQTNLDTAGYGDADLARYKYNAGLREEIAALNAASAKASQVAQERIGLQEQLNSLTDTAAQALTRQRDALNESNRALFDSVQAAQAKQAADAAALAAQQAVTAERQGLQEQLNSLTDTAAQALTRQRDALDESNRALFDSIQAVKAEQAETQRLAGVATQRGQIEIEIMQLQGNASGALAAQRALELAALDATLVPLQNVIYGLQDVAAAAEAAAASAQAAGTAYFASIDRNANAASFTDQGQSALDKLYGTTTVSAGDAAVAAANDSLAAAKTAAQAWRGVGDTLRSVLQGISSETVKLSGNAYNVLYSQFKTLTVLARGGDAESAGKIGGVANAFLTASEENSATLQDYLRDRSRVENSLKDTLKSVDASTSVQDLIANSSAAAVTQLTSMNANLTGYAAQVYELLSKGYSGADRTTAAGASAQYGSASADFANYFATTASGSSRDFAGGSLTRLGGDLAQFTGADGRVDYIRAGESLLDVGKRITAIRSTWEQQYGITLPAFARGGVFGGGIRLVGENGPELEVTGPSRIYSSEQTRNMLQGGGQNTARLEAVIEALAEKVEALTKSQEEGNGYAKTSSEALQGNQRRPILVEMAAS